MSGGMFGLRDGLPPVQMKAWHLGGFPILVAKLRGKRCAEKKSTEKFPVDVGLKLTASRSSATTMLPTLTGTLLAVKEKIGF